MSFLRSSLCGFSLFWLPAALASAGCAENAAAHAGADAPQLVGVTDDGRFAVAFVRTETEAVGYVCGRDAESILLSRWLRGAVDDTGLSALVAPASGEPRGTVQFVAESAAASIVLDDGTAVDLVAEPVSERSSEGLYGAMDAGCRTGVIVRGDDAALVDGTWCSASGARRQVTPISPVIFEQDALWVLVPGITEHEVPRELYVERVDAER
jgi:hypothetical protein